MLGHLGVNKTYYKILNHFYWPGLKTDASKYCRSCHTCQMVGKPNQVIPKAGFLFCYERDFMLSLSEDNHSDVIEAFNSTSRYLDDLLNIDNDFFDSMVNRVYPSELQLNKTNVSDTEASFFDLHLSISGGFVKTKIYDKRDDFDFDIVNFPFLDGDVPCSISIYGVFISQLIRFARKSSHVDAFNTRKKF